MSSVVSSSVGVDASSSGGSSTSSNAAIGVSGRPSSWLLSLSIGSQVDALDEIGYRQWRHATILECGHLPGQSIHDSATIGTYKIRWTGWDSQNKE